MILPARPEVGYELYLSNNSGISGKLRKKIDDFRVEEIIEKNEQSHWNWTKKEENGKHCIAKITADNWDTHILVKKISQQLGIGQRAVGFAGTKDKRAVTTQYFSLFTSPEKLSKIDLKQIEIEFLHKTTKPIRLGNLIGNKFLIKISEISGSKSDISTILNELKEGFPNYFGIQRFGAIRPITHIVGKKIVKGDCEGAVWDYLTNEGSSNQNTEARKFLRENRNLEIALEKFPTNLFFERQMIKHLIKNENDYIGALKKLPENLSKMLVHSYQSLIFNSALNERIGRGLGVTKPMVGDKIMPMDKYAGPDQRKIIEVTDRNLNKLEKRCKEGKAWIVGLLPGIKSRHSNGLQSEIESTIMKNEEVEFKDFKIDMLPELSSLGMYRPLSQRVNELEWKVDNSGNAIFKFWLHKGTYATSFLREIMKCKDVKNY